MGEEDTGAGTDKVRVIGDIVRDPVCYVAHRCFPGRVMNARGILLVHWDRSTRRCSGKTNNSNRTEPNMNMHLDIHVGLRQGLEPNVVGRAVMFNGTRVM